MKTMKTMALLGIAVSCCALFGCNDSGAAETVPTNGTVVVLFPEWTNSSYVLEQRMATNITAVFSNKAWKVRCDDVPVWSGDPDYLSLEAARRVFAINIDWKVQRAVANAFAP